MFSTSASSEDTGYTKHVKQSDSTPTFVDIWKIYFEHYGKEEIENRKRHYSASLLVRSDMMFVLRQMNRGPVLDQDHMCRRLVTISKRVEEDQIKMKLPLQFRKCYRNEIYPAEIHDPDSIFYGVHLQRIDALLLDRPDNGQSFQNRGKFSELPQRTAWLVEMKKKQKAGI